MEKYTTLLEMDGWSFMSDPEGYGGTKEYIFLAHMVCPLGVELEIRHEAQAKLPSVMHYENYICQRCNAQPPDGLFGAYKLYEWGKYGEVKT
jgi:hypothetical protein